MRGGSLLLAGLLGLAVSAPAAPPTTDRIVIAVSIDGLRPDAWDQAPTPHLDRLAAAGSATREAMTNKLSVTLPSHASMISGVGPSRHHILWNSSQPGLGSIEVPTIFRWCRAAGLATGLFVAKRKLKSHLVAPGEVEVVSHPGWGSRRVVGSFLGHLSLIGDRGGFFLVHLPEVDGSGHEHGWMSPEQLQAVADVDGWIGELRRGVHERQLDARVTWIVTSDHGGKGKGHGGGSPVERRIPFVLSGAGIRRGATLPAGVSVCDVAPTAARLLGLPVPAGLDGRALDAAILGAGAP